MEPEKQTAADELISNTQGVESDEYQASYFFEGLAQWEPPTEKTSFLKRIFRKTKAEYELKPCVFVADGEEPIVKYFPVDPNSQLLTNPITKEVYLKPIKGDIFFFHKHKCLPLSNCPPVSETYDLPEHLALKFYNLGLGEGELAGYKALLEKINKWQFQVTMALVVTAITVIACAYMFKTNSAQVESMQATVQVLAEMYGK